MISLFDVVLLIALSGFIFYGLFFGLIRTFGTFLGVLVGAFLASRLYLTAFEWVREIFLGYENLGKVIVFIVIFSLVNRLTAFAFYLLDRAFHILSIIPFLKTFNRLGGAVLGFLTGSLFIGLIIFVASKYAFLETWFGRWLSVSELAPFFLKFANLLLPLLPEILKKIQTFV